MAALLNICLGSAQAANCLENRDFYQNLPTVIGKEDQVAKQPFALNCDTVFVRKGVTTVVYPGTMLYFANPSLNCIIKVEGALLIKGTKNSYVSLSGSIDSGRYSVEPGNRQWGGIEVAEGGRLEVEFAGFMRAPTPITAFSPQVKIVNSWFKGSTGIILPDGSLYNMEASWHAINELDLAKANAGNGGKAAEPPADALSEKENAELLGDREPGFWTWKKVAGGAAALAVIGVGTSLYLAPAEKKVDHSDGNPNPKPTKITLDKWTLDFPPEN
jgi:hypothetical protein